MQPQQLHFSVPAAVEQCVNYNVIQPLRFPEMYSADAFIPVLRCFAVFGRRGNHIGDAIAHTIAERDKNIVIQRLTVRPEFEGEDLRAAEQLLCVQGSGVVLLEGAEIWATTPDYLVRRRFLEFDALCRHSTSNIVMLIFHAPPSELPHDMRQLYFVNQV
jgi:hypothetical protein